MNLLLVVLISILASTPIMEQSPKNVTVLDGKDATIVCRAVGAPQPSTVWTMNNGKFFLGNLKYLQHMKLLTKFIDLDTTPIEQNGRVQVLENGDLLISNVRETDSGWYNCIRSNEAGTVTGQAYLGVMGTYLAITSNT